MQIQTFQLHCCIKIPKCDVWNRQLLQTTFPSDSPGWILQCRVCQPSLILPAFIWFALSSPAILDIHIHYIAVTIPHWDFWKEVIYWYWWKAESSKKWIHILWIKKRKKKDCLQNKTLLRGRNELNKWIILNNSMEMGVLLTYCQYVYINRGFEVHFNFKMPYTTLFHTTHLMPSWV